jgi:hypothetical protein
LLIRYFLGMRGGLNGQFKLMSGSASWAFNINTRAGSFRKSSRDASKSIANRSRVVGHSNENLIFYLNKDGSPGSSGASIL